MRGIVFELYYGITENNFLKREGFFGLKPFRMQTLKAALTNPVNCLKQE